MLEKQCRRSSLILPTKTRLLLAVRKLAVALRVAYGLLIRRRTMEISFRGRGARAGRNNNLLTSHARNATRYLASAHAFELPPSLSALSEALHRPGIAYGSRSCQPQLSFIVSTIYDSVYTGGSGGGDDIGPFRDVLKFRSDSSARDRSYILAGDSTAHHAPFYSWYLHPWYSPHPRLISHHANLELPLLNYPYRNYVIIIFFFFEKP